MSRSMPIAFKGATTPPPLGRRLRSLIFDVVDESMRPLLKAGDRILVDTAAYRHHVPEVGDIIVFRDPQEPRRRLVKRVAAPVDPARGGGVSVLGTDPEQSRDSRSFGPVPPRLILGKAWYRTGPPGREGSLEQVR